jgi:hypothetical protein
MAAATKGELSVLVVALPGAEPVLIPRTVLQRLIPSRGGLTDHPVRLSLPIVLKGGGDEGLYVLMRAGIFIISKKDFNAWCVSERRKGKWPSQRQRKKRPEGRPSSQTERLRNAVLELVDQQKWNGDMSVPSLHRLLIETAGCELPSEDTLRRLVDRLFGETGDARLRITARRRVKRA